MIIVQLSLVGEADGYRLLPTNNTSGSGAERSFGPSIRQKVVKVLGGHIEPSPTTTQATEQVVKNLWIHRNSDGGASNVTNLSNLTDEIIDDFFPFLKTDQREKLSLEQTSFQAK